MSRTEHGRYVVRKSGASSVAAPNRRVRRTCNLLQHAYRNQRLDRVLWAAGAGAVVQRYQCRLIGDLLRRHLRPRFTRAGGLRIWLPRTTPLTHWPWLSRSRPLRTSP
jgi:hypothetical protein